MKNITTVIVLLLLTPTILWLALGVIKFHSLTISDVPPSWGDGINAIAMSFAFVSVYIVYKQLVAQKVKENLDRIDSGVDQILNHLETIRFQNFAGSEAIVEYGRTYHPTSTPHPRILVDKLQYLTSQVELGLIDLIGVNAHEEKKRLAQKICLLFYTNLYFPVSLLGSGQVGLLQKLESQYDPFKKKFTSIMALTYILLRHWDLIVVHQQSEPFLRIAEINGDSNVLSIYNHFRAAS